MFSQLFIVLPAIIAGVAATEPYCESETVCIDAVNDCGVKYGGCFDTCEPDTSPTPPPCAGTTLVPEPSAPTEDCSERTVCWDGINECGMMYGGCFPDCQPWPTFEPPPCPSSSSWGTVTASATATATAEPGCETGGSLIICVDGIDECGNGWGGCYDVCSEPAPEKPTTPCSVTPSNTTTPCSVTPSPTEPQPTETNCEDITVCVDHINECGMLYGGCHSVCSPTPTYTAPACPSDTGTGPGCKPKRRE